MYKSATDLTYPLARAPIYEERIAITSFCLVVIISLSFGKTIVCKKVQSIFTESMFDFFEILIDAVSALQILDDKSTLA